MERCLLNLFANALQNTPRYGVVTLSAEIVNRKLCLRVSDTGQGMESEKVRQLLAALGRRRRIRKLNLQREAFGLSVVKAFCQGMQGRFLLESVPGEGTSVEMWFPLLP